MKKGGDVCLSLFSFYSLSGDRFDFSVFHKPSELGVGHKCIHVTGFDGLHDFGILQYGLNLRIVFQVHNHDHEMMLVSPATALYFPAKNPTNMNMPTTKHLDIGLFICIVFSPDNEKAYSMVTSGLKSYKT